jgi:hypothetical protein
LYICNRYASDTYSGGIIETACEKQRLTFGYNHNRIVNYNINIVDRFSSSNQGMRVSATLNVEYLTQNSIKEIEDESVTEVVEES